MRHYRPAAQAGSNARELNKAKSVADTVATPAGSAAPGPAGPAHRDWTSPPRPGRGPGSYHQARARNTFGGKGFQRQRGVVQRSQPGLGDDQHRRTEFDREIAQRHPVGTDLHQQATGAPRPG
jgi:hypothetical protein